MFIALKKYAVFSGRASRREFLLFVLLCIILELLAGVATIIIFTVYYFQGGLLLLPMFVALLLIIPSIAVSVRRLHDTNRSGCWLLLAFVPFAGFIALTFLATPLGWWLLTGWVPVASFIALFALACLEGEKGENRFGPAPNV